MGVFSRFEQVPGEAKDRHTRNGLIVLAILGAVLYYAYTSGSIPLLPKSGEVVTAEFASAANVTAGKTPVRVAGVEVGEVEKVERLDNGRGVRVKMRITDDGVKLRKDAKAHIYWRTLLGFAFYIELDEGSAPQSLGNQTIAKANTTTQVELDEVLAGLTPPSRAGIQTLFSEFDKGFEGDDAGNAIDALGPSMKQVAPGLGALRGSKPGDLTDTVRSASRFMGALAKNEAQLGQVVNHANTTLGVTAARRASLDSTLRNGPSALDQTRQTMVRLRGTLETLDPIADSLRPGVRVLDDASLAVRPALAELRPTLDDARPLLTDLRPALTSLRTASEAGVPFMDALDPTLDRLQSSILPALEKTGKDTGLKSYEAIGPAIASVAASSSLYDSYSYVQHFQAVAGGGNSAGLLPCGLNVAPLGVNCGTLNDTITKLFTGGLPGSKSRSSELRSDSGGGSSSSSSASKSSNPAVKSIARLTGLLGG